MRLLAIMDNVVVVIGVLAIIVGTHGAVAADWQWLINAIVWAATIVFAAELFLRLKFGTSDISMGADGAGRTALSYLATPAGWIDVILVFVIPAVLAASPDFAAARLVGLLWMLKFGRYSSGLALLGRVIRNAGESLLSVLLGFVILMVIAATLMYLIEGPVQPEQFGSIPLAMWWAIVTLTTTGYGDVTPVSFAGRVLGGGAMICGIGMFALWAGILASGFADELRRREFLRTWDLVAKVPFFSELGADAIAAVARLLKTRQFATGQTVMRRGEPGEAMYFVVSGEVEVRLDPKPVRLSADHFFGEMALISGEPRTATVVAVQPCVLLELDVADFRQLAGDRPELLRAIAAEAQRRGAVAGALA